MALILSKPSKTHQNVVKHQTQIWCVSLGTQSHEAPIVDRSTHPTDFIVVAHTDQNYVNGVSFRDDGVTLVDGNGRNVRVANRNSVLTVWRTLYVERDSMAAPDWTEGDAPSRIASGNITNVSLDQRTITTDIEIHGSAEDQFQGGFISLKDASDEWLGSYPVAGNSTGQNAKIFFDVNIPLNAAKFEYLDDDDIQGGVTANDMVPDLSWWASRYEPVHVRVNTTKTDLNPENGNSVNQNNIAFDPNFGSDEDEHYDELEDLFAANKQSVSSADFWVIYQLGAFQGPMDQDLDPDYEDWTGYLVGYALSNFLLDPQDPPVEPGTVVYAEVVRESEYASGVEIEPEHLWAALSLHESGHEWGMRDHPDDGPIMNTNLKDVWIAGTAEQRDGLVFSGAALGKVMTADYPR